jgi:hypothetical protein
MEDPGAQLALVARGLNITTQRIYSAIYCYCRGIEWEEREKGGRPRFLNDQGENLVARQVENANAEHSPMSHLDVLYALRAKAIEDNGAAFFLACSFPLKPVLTQIAHLGDTPSPQYASEFLKQHAISLVTSSAVTAARGEAATASNILNWYRTIYAPELAAAFAEGYMFNADEIFVEFDMSCKVCKPKGVARAAASVEETSPGHISLMLTSGKQNDGVSSLFAQSSASSILHCLRLFFIIFL